MIRTPSLCICGRAFSSRQGLGLHLKRCAQAKERAAAALDRLAHRVCSPPIVVSEVPAGLRVALGQSTVPEIKLPAYSGPSVLDRVGPKGAKR